MGRAKQKPRRSFREVVTALVVLVAVAGLVGGCGGGGSSGGGSGGGTGGGIGCLIFFPFCLLLREEAPAHIEGEYAFNGASLAVLTTDRDHDHSGRLFLDQDDDDPAYAEGVLLLDANSRAFATVVTGTVRGHEWTYEGTDPITGSTISGVAVFDEIGSFESEFTATDADLEIYEGGMEGTLE